MEGIWGAGKSTFIQRGMGSNDVWIPEPMHIWTADRLSGNDLERWYFEAHMSNIRAAQEWLDMADCVYIERCPASTLAFSRAVLGKREDEVNDLRQEFRSSIEKLHSVCVVVSARDIDRTICDMRENAYLHEFASKESLLRLERILKEELEQAFSQVIYV